MRSLAENYMGPEGTAALAEVLAETKIQILKCAATEMCRVRQCPLFHRASIETRPGRPACARSLYCNNMGVEGTAALVKVLPETQIKDLKCAAAERVR